MAVTELTLKVHISDEAKPVVKALYDAAIACHTALFSSDGLALLGATTNLKKAINALEALNGTDFLTAESKAPV